MALLRAPRHALYDGSAVPPLVARRFLRLAARARDGAPVQYLVRSAPFLDLDLYVDRRVLIPRPETEELVLRSLARLTRTIGPSTPRPLFLDYGTGSGCIAIAVARLLPGSRVIAVDASAAALTVARRNVSRYRLGRRVRLVRARTLREPPLARLAGRLDLVIANPPYVPSPRLARLARRVRDFEPKSGLDGGPKGTNIVAMILEQGPGLLRPGGLLAMEIDATQRRFVLGACPAAVVEPDLNSRPRYVFLTRPGKERQ